MDRKGACLTQVSLCRERAEADPANRNRWIEQATRWLQIATSSTGAVVMTYEIQPAETKLWRL